MSEATISRDLVRIFAKHTRGQCCPFCGAKPLDEDGVLAIQEGHDRFRRWLGLPDDEDTEDDEPVELNGAEVFTVFGELAEAKPPSSDADKG